MTAAFASIALPAVAPVAWQRPAQGKGSKRYTPVAMASAKEEWQWAALEAMGSRRPCSFPVVVFARFVLPTRGRVDLDNLCKLPMDAFNGVVWDDDSQVVVLQAEKVYAADCDRDPMPGSWVRVWRAAFGQGDEWAMATVEGRPLGRGLG